MRDKRTKPLLEKLENQGWRITEKTKGWMCYPPDKTKQAVMIHKTPSDARWYANCMSHLKRSGYIE
ncbi:hypothetical protein CE156_10355 [Bifidobacterium breve]|nr:hypothetical protein CE156_10355 [Bifidobacterium breve]